MLAADRVVPSIIKLLKKEFLCDANVQTSDSPLRVHRVVLAAFSERLLYGFLKEEKAAGNELTHSTIKLTEFSSTTLNNVISFCYTGACDNLTDANIEEMLMCCRRLNITMLLDRCIDIFSKFNIENAVHYYGICKRCELVSLSERIYEFICTNFLRISRTQSFKKCDHKILMEILTDDCLSAPSELSILEAALAWLDAQPASELSETIAEEVIKCVRLSLIKPEDIIRIAEPKLRERANPYSGIMQAMMFHSLNDTESALTSQFASRPRTGPVPKKGLNDLAESDAEGSLCGKVFPDAVAWNLFMTDSSQPFPKPPAANRDDDYDFEVRSASLKSGSTNRGLKAKLNEKGLLEAGQPHLIQVQEQLDDFPDSASDMMRSAAAERTGALAFDGQAAGCVCGKSQMNFANTPFNANTAPFDPRMTAGFDPRMFGGPLYDPRMAAAPGAPFFANMAAGLPFNPRMAACSPFYPGIGMSAPFVPTMTESSPFYPRMFGGAALDPRMAAFDPRIGMAAPVCPTMAGAAHLNPQLPGDALSEPLETITAACVTSTARKNEVATKPTVYLTGGIEISRRFDCEGLCVLKSSPDQGQWSVCAKIKCDTHHHASVTLNGEIYITGGFIFNEDDPSDYGKATDLVSVFNPSNKMWTSAAKLLDCRAHHGAVVYRKKIYVVCGVNKCKWPLEAVEEYDPGEDKWTEVCTLPSGRLGAAVALCQNSIYIVGGFNRYQEFPVLDEVLCLDLTTFTFTQMKPYSLPICHAALACVHDELYLVGGRTVLIEKSGNELRWDTRSSDVILKFDKTDEEWDPVEFMQVARHDASVAVAGNTLVIIGGMCSPSKITLESVECFDVEKLAWNNSFPTLPAALSGVSAVCL